MSHISTYKTKIQNVNLLLVVAAAKNCQVINGEQTVKQFGRNEVEAIASFKPFGWKYPIAITKDGEIKYDNWGSESGTMDALGKIIQRYNEEVIYANVDYSQVKNSYKEVMEDGSLKLVFEY